MDIENGDGPESVSQEMFGQRTTRSGRQYNPWELGVIGSPRKKRATAGTKKKGAKVSEMGGNKLVVQCTSDLEDEGIEGIYKAYVIGIIMYMYCMEIHLSICISSNIPIFI